MPTPPANFKDKYMDYNVGDIIEYIKYKYLYYVVKINKEDYTTCYINEPCTRVLGAIQKEFQETRTRLVTSMFREEK